MSEDKIEDCIESGDCAEVLENLFAYMDGQLSEDPQHRVDVHINKCQYCRDAVDVEAHLREILRSACVQQAPASLRLRIKQEIRFRAKNPR
ncbi:mycothiol system anti-sigma-R factor [Boudabousia marimammalium]|uniref:Mycothiol system anti-sigma-R factor n=1 Tax=Boudabousia marimammalium TaxID=156892 RepID=A0A1Q5PRH8_9ACTO|nr:mycothiol system anti-sigma-R factor [Boudabousia marimammalium]OKL50184.1 mycothiol system anti-sigma-R factor [Boudabousia marimammalium]